MVVMHQYTRRIIGFGVHALNVDGRALCRIFSDATSDQGWTKILAQTTTRYFNDHRWKTNRCVLEVKEIKALPHVPLSHPYVERLIGSIRPELRDRTLSWTAADT